MNNHAIQPAIDALERQTAVVIPVYLGRHQDPDGARAILHSTVQMFVREVNAPQSICLSVDGPDAGAAIAYEFAK